MGDDLENERETGEWVMGWRTGAKAENKKLENMDMETDAVKRWMERRQKSREKTDEEFLNRLEELHIPVERTTPPLNRA